MTFDQHIGMSRGDSDSEAKIETQDHHLNPTGNINGGVLISLADNLATGVANRHWREKTGDQAFLVGVDLHAVMLTNQQGGTIIARSEPVRIGRRIVVIRTQVSGEDNKLLAEITSTHIPVAN
jgi:1,4-dihydroxy-2-naphthoyl-CoA hydrolase